METIALIDRLYGVSIIAVRTERWIAMIHPRITVAKIISKYTYEL